MFGRDPYGERRPSEGEYHIVALVAQGLNNGDVARKIRTTRSVIKNRLRIIYDKLGVWNRGELARWCAEGERARRRAGAVHFPLKADDDCEAQGLRQNLDFPDEST